MTTEALSSERMGEEEYIALRLDDQINWYDRKSQKAQRWFKILRGIEIIAAAAIPLIAGFAKAPFPSTLVVAILGAAIAIVSAFISLNQLQEKWIDYRTTCETLRHEKFLYLTRVEPYQQKNSFHLFVQRIEGLISKENTAWSKNANTSIDGTASKSGKG